MARFSFSSAGSGATIVGESTVPRKAAPGGVVPTIATQAGSSKIMHPEEDLSLVRHLVFDPIRL